MTPLLHLCPLAQSYTQHCSAGSPLPVQPMENHSSHTQLAPLPPLSCHPLPSPRRRSLLDAGDSFGGYTLLASESSVAYNLIDTRNAFTTRSLDPAHRETVLSGLLLHVVRKPSTETLMATGGINVKSDSVAQICASATRFRGLISACTTDAGVFGNTTASGKLLGGIGSDPVFSRCALGFPSVLGSWWGCTP